MARAYQLYSYPACTTCKKAERFLAAAGIDCVVHHIVECPPNKTQLRRMVQWQGGDIKKLLNTSGELYRELRLKDRVASMSHEELFDLLASHGKLIRRPFLIGDEVGLVGFKEEVWRASLGVPQ